jgi:hypothetical protein
LNALEDRELIKRTVPTSREQAVDRALIESHLAQAERNISEGERHLARQRELVARLEQDGHDATQARKSFALFEELQALHIAHRDWLRNELAQAEHRR